MLILMSLSYRAQVFFVDMLDTLDFAVIMVSYVVTVIYSFVELSGFTRY